jgi:hypothetical protein
MTELTDILSKPPAGRLCSFATWFDSLTEDEQVSVKKAMFDPAWSDHKLTETLRDFGLTTDRGRLGKHRRGECKRCGPL